MAADLVVTDTLVLSGSELEWTAVRSGGPGGQNVNKVSTKVELRFAPGRSSVLSAAVRERLLRLAAGRLDAVGRIVITCDSTRSQSRNLELACERLATLIRSALVVPKRRRATRPSQASRRARVADKRRAGDQKRQRSDGSWE